MNTLQLDYWTVQLRSALSTMEPDAVLVKYPDDGEIEVEIADELTREERAELIRGLERRGFTVLSTTDEPIRVDGTAEPLNHPFDDSVGFSGGGQA